MKSLSRAQLFVTPWTAAYQAPPSMGFSRQECWSGSPFPSPGDLPDPGIESGSPRLQADALPCEPLHRIKSNYGKDRFPWWLRHYSACLQCRRPGFDPWVRKILWRRKRQPTPVLLVKTMYVLKYFYS